MKNLKNLVMSFISDLPNAGNNGMTERQNVGNMECWNMEHWNVSITEVLLEVRTNYLLSFERDFSNFMDIF